MPDQTPGRRILGPLRDSLANISGSKSSMGSETPKTMDHGENAQSTPSRRESDFDTTGDSASFATPESSIIRHRRSSSGVEPMNTSQGPRTPLHDTTNNSVRGSVEATAKAMARVSLKQSPTVSPSHGNSPSQRDSVVPAVSPGMREHSMAISPSLREHSVAISPSLKEPKVVEPATPRLTIHKLVLNDFKSYAGRQEVGPFHSSFSAVVGPNGSGKSNVIDSLLFVFGFRASKMRHSKISSLIHNSAAHPSLSSCSVEVHFCDVMDQVDESGETVSVPVEGSEIVVTRRAFRNNSSQYYINGKHSNFTQVTTLLKDRGIDLDHKRFLILQGEVESIAQMKPKAENSSEDGLLEYLEDIIGTSSYKQPIEDASKRYEELNEECNEKAGRLDIVARELKDLEGQRNEMLATLKVENDITLKKSQLYQKEMHLAVEKIAVSEQAIAENEAKLAEEKAATEQAQREIKELEARGKQQSKELDILRKALQQQRKQLDKRELDKVQLEETRKHILNKRTKLEKSMESATYSKQEAIRWVETYNEESKELETKLSTLQTELLEESKVLEEIQASLQGKTQQYTDEISHTQSLLDPWRQQITAKESEIAIAESQVALLIEKSTSLERSFEEWQDKVDSISREGRQKEAELAEFQEKLRFVDSQIVEGTKECEFARAKTEERRVAARDLRTKVDHERKARDDMESQSKVQRALNKFARSGSMTGKFYGRLGSLGTIDARFDVAVSTACGSSLENMVVDSVETGRQCVEYLRKTGAGRAKFILLEQLPKYNLGPINPPEGVPRLFDLIKCEDKFRPAFYSIMYDTLVAKDDVQARRIGFGASKRYRVITLGGILVEPSGAMSGGGRALSGLMSHKDRGQSSGEDLPAMEQELAEREDLVRKCEDAYNDMINTLNDLKEQKPQLELEISKTELDISSLEKNLQVTQEKLEEIKAEMSQTKSDNAELKSAEQRVEHLKQELAEQRVGARGLEDKLAELEEKIMAAGGMKLRMQKSKVDGIRDQIQLVNGRLANGNVERAHKENDIKKHDKVIANATKEVEQGKELELETEKKMEQLVKGAIGEMQRQVESVQEELDSREDDLAKVKEELEEKQQSVDEVRSQEVQISNELYEQKNVLNKEKAIANHCREKLGGLVLHDIKEIASELVEFTREELESVDVNHTKNEISSLEESIKDARVDKKVLQLYDTKKHDYDERRDVLNEAVANRDAAKETVDDLKSRRLNEFMAGFTSISKKLKDMYQMITMGGNADLDLIDTLDPFSEGILFSVMPPKKSWRNIANLSGGEKTLSSLALVFALHHYKPTPLYVMDEIDAALDFRNVSIVATYIKERTKNGQFIVISLRNNMFELAQQLVGIYKVNNMTRSVAIRNSDYLRQ